MGRSGKAIFLFQMLTIKQFLSHIIPYSGGYLTISFYMPNNKDPKRELRYYAISTLELESIIGRRLFDGLDRKTAKSIKGLLPLKELGL